MGKDVTGRAASECRSCGAKVLELRRGRCWGCFTGWVDAQGASPGASCAACSERRREFLRKIKLDGRLVALCHDCAALAMKLPLAETGARGLRRALDRRKGERRTGWRADRRAALDERRVGERRDPLPRRGAPVLSPDEALARPTGPAADDLDIEIARG